MKPVYLTFILAAALASPVPGTAFAQGKSAKRAAPALGHTARAAGQTSGQIGLAAGNAASVDGANGFSVGTDGKLQAGIVQAISPSMSLYLNGAYDLREGVSTQREGDLRGTFGFRLKF